MPVAAAAANALKKRDKSSNSEVQVPRDKIPQTIELSIARGIILSRGSCNNIIILDLDMSSQLLGHSG